MTIPFIYGILIVEKNKTYQGSIDKGKPFERVGPRLRLIATPGQPKLDAKAIQRRLNKALEPKSPSDLWLSAAKRI